MNASPRNALDRMLEATIVGSFSRIGETSRRSLQQWAPFHRVEGRVVVITGATSGIGQAAAAELAGLGARIHFLARDRGRAEHARQHIMRSNPNAFVDFTIADLNDLRSVCAFGDAVLARYPSVDVLIHNAGGLHQEYGLSADGFEQTVATHVLAPHELTSRLLPALREATDARVITVSSGGMYSQAFDATTIEMGRDKYDGVKAYARAKRAQVALNGARTHREQEVESHSTIAFRVMHPGWVATPGVEHGLPTFARVMRPLLRTPAQGADTIVWLATEPDIEQSDHGIWLDRTLRWEHKVPWTRREGDHEAAWQWCVRRLEAISS